MSGRHAPARTRFSALWGVFAVGVFAALGLVACGGSGGSDGAAGADGPIELGPTGPANPCAQMVFEGPAIAKVFSSATYENTATGGAVTPGVYVAVSETLFTHSSNPGTFQATLSFWADGTQQEVFAGSDIAPAVTGGTWTASGTSLVLNETCPGVQTTSVSYTATDTTLTLFNDTAQIITAFNRR